MTRRGLTKVASASTFALLLASASAWAQPVVTADPSGAVAPSAATPDSEIVVTGSRIRNNAYDQPTPVISVSTDRLAAAAPTNIADGLLQLPQFKDTVSRASCCGYTSNGNFLDLRGLGSIRTLTLLDGNRIVPSRETGDADVNLLPELLIKRVDVVTGGASAAYGSDAVSGVVNYITDYKFEGVKFIGQGGVSTYGDDGSQKLGFAFGHAFAGGRAHLIASVEYFNQNGALSQRDRPTGRGDYVEGGDGSAANPYNLYSGTRYFGATPGGLITSAGIFPFDVTGADPLAGTVFLPGGGYRAYRPGVTIPGALATVGGDGVPLDFAAALSPLTDVKAFSRLSYDFNDRLHGFLRVNYGRSVTKSVGVPIYFNDLGIGVNIGRDNAFLPPGIGALMGRNGVNSFELSVYNPTPGLEKVRVENNTFDIAGGVSGEFGKDWSWQVSGSHGETRVRTDVYNDTIVQNFYAAADAVRDPTGNMVCRVTLTNPGLYPGCVPLNLFGGTPSQAATNYISGDDRARALTQLDTVEASLQGTLFTLPAGDVKVAAGGEYRRRSLRLTSNPIALSEIDPTGLRGIPTGYCPTPTTCNVGGFSSANGGIASASDDVEEGFGEIELPVLRNVPGFRQLSLNGAVRYTNYSSSGDVVTWKAGGIWSPTDGVRFRATRSRDIRAPNLYELYSAAVGGFALRIIDPQTGTLVTSVNTITAGNSRLRPEKGDTTTVGVTLQPRFLRGFSGTVDYFDIDLEQAITSASAQGIVNACAAGDSASCAQITRDTGGNLSLIRVGEVNSAQRHVRGIDFDFSYTGKVLDGEASLRFVATELLRYDEDALGNENIDGKVSRTSSSGASEFRGNLAASYERDGAGLFVQERYIGPLIRLTPVAGQFIRNAHISEVFYTDLTVHKLVRTGLGAGGFDFFVTINNLFDRKPPIYAPYNLPALGFPAVSANGYDIDGRYITSGVRVKF